MRKRAKEVVGTAVVVGLVLVVLYSVKPGDA